MKKNLTPPPFSERCRTAFTECAQMLASIRWGYLLIALCFSATLWYGLTVRDKVETWVDVRLEFKSMPQELVVRGGLAEKVSVRIRAAKGLSRTLTSRTYSLSLDLARLVKGTNTIHIEQSMLPFTGAYEIIEISPSRIQVVADNRESREIRVEATFNGALPKDFYIASLQITPESVTVRGAESLVVPLTRVAAPISLREDMGKGEHEFPTTLGLPEGVSADPPQVAVRMELAIRTKPVRVLREVTLETPPGIEVRSVPARVSIQADVPESGAGKNSTLAGITAMADIPEDAVTGSVIKVPVHVLLPENALLDGVTPPELTVTVVKGVEPPLTEPEPVMESMGAPPATP